MKAARSILKLVFLCGVLATAPVFAQDTDAPEQSAPPDLASLDQNWWDYFDGPAEQAGPRIDDFLDRVNEQISDLSVQNQELAPTIVQAA